MCIRDRVYLVDENTADGLVGHSSAGDPPILHGEIDGGGIQTEVSGTVSFHGIVITGLQREVAFPTPPGGHGIHQVVVADPADLKGGVGDPLRFVRRADLSELNAALRLIIKVEGLDLVVLRDLNGLRGDVYNRQIFGRCSTLQSSWYAYFCTVWKLYPVLRDISRKLRSSFSYTSLIYSI